MIPTRILLAGGGTGGHLFPALSVAEALDRKGAALVFVGTHHGIEARIIPDKGFPIEFLWLSGFQRRKLLSNLLLPLKVIAALAQSFAILRRYRPRAALGTGGYVCGPILLAATLCRIPFFLQEQNSYPGVTTRLLSRFAKGIFLNFPEAANHLTQPGKCRHVGNPVRIAFKELDRQTAVVKWGLNANLPTVLAFGGSQGAMRINTAVREALPELSSICNLIWSSGDKDNRDITGWSGPGVLVKKPFIEEMSSAYAAADLAICRSGAMTLSELAAAGVPAILIPYPFAAGDHQRHNAAAFVQAGGALMIEDNELTGARLCREIESLLKDRGRLETMRAAQRAIPRQDAADIIATALLEAAKGTE
ncbi:MAG: undecaprenyldiphospho-muramoylpentapeptide beta-N-acetylglucosaminyltransferase [bacterium]|nr:undecaprenyldiphospho-muramoylpentapeptide beta-N-acetylglucosaminyltransferase [bacterium]